MTDSGSGEPGARIPLPLRRTAALAVVVVAATAVAAVLLEVVIFAFEPYLARSFQFDAETGFKVKPFADGSNSLGFCDTEYPFERRPGTYRILFIGDSYGWMGGPDGNYTALLEQKFAQQYGPGRVEVINTGYSMTHTVEQLGVLRRVGLRFQPDLVVLGFFTGNDFVDGDPNRKRIVLMDTYFDVDRREEPRALFGRPLMWRSRLLPFAQQRLITLRELHRRDEGAGMSPEAYFPMEGAHINFYNRLRHQRGEYAVNVQHILRDGVDAMHRLVSADEAQFAVVILPTDFSVVPSRAAAVFEHFGMNPAEYDLELAQKILRAHLDDRGIPYVDLLEDFRRDSRRDRLYRPFDNHWAADGNAAGAELVYAWLKPTVDAALSTGRKSAPASRPAAGTAGAP